MTPSAKILVLLVILFTTVVILSIHWVSFLVAFGIISGVIAITWVHLTKNLQNKSKKYY